MSTAQAQYESQTDVDTVSDSGAEARSVSRRRGRRRQARQTQMQQPQQQALQPIQQPLQQVGGLNQMQAQGGKKADGKDTLRLRLDLNLDVEVELKARIPGDLTLALLYVYFSCHFLLHIIVPLNSYILSFTKRSPNRWLYIYSN